MQKTAYWKIIHRYRNQNIIQTAEFVFVDDTKDAARGITTMASITLKNITGT